MFAVDKKSATPRIVRLFERIYQTSMPQDGTRMIEQL